MLHPYALLIGVTTLALFMGCTGRFILVLKTEGAMHDKFRGWVNNGIIFFCHLLCDRDDGDTAGSISRT